MTSQDDNLRLSATSQIRKLLSIGEFLAWRSLVDEVTLYTIYSQRSIPPFRMSLILA